jgi:hypothetical protein
MARSRAARSDERAHELRDAIPPPIALDVDARPQDVVSSPDEGLDPFARVRFGCSSQFDQHRYEHRFDNLPRGVFKDDAPHQAHAPGESFSEGCLPGSCDPRAGGFEVRQVRAIGVKQKCARTAEAFNFRNRFVSQIDCRQDHR